MALITWEEKFSVGIVSIDDQHKKLVELVNKLHEAMGQGRGDKILKEVLAELIEYTKTHFSYEEKLMANNGYPEFMAHKSEHDQLTRKVLEFQAAAQTGQMALSVSLSSFLKTWLLSHIAGYDKKYSLFLVSKGVK